jgi:hypothetical protein
MIDAKLQDLIKAKPQEKIGPRLETTPVHIKRILAATDFSEQATLALKFAARLGKRPSLQTARAYRDAAILRSR